MQFFEAQVVSMSACRQRPGVIALDVSSILGLLCHPGSRTASFAAPEIMYNVVFIHQTSVIFLYLVKTDKAFDMNGKASIRLDN